MRTAITVGKKAGKWVVLADPSVPVTAQVSAFRAAKAAAALPSGCEEMHLFFSGRESAKKMKTG